jgi:hypothetical protein
VLGAAVSASTSVVDSFQKASSVGATFGGSVNAMARAASGAGMTIDQFAGMLAQNGENLMLLGGNTAEGAKRFGELSKVMRSSGVNAELMRMGYSTKDINQGIMNYASTMGRTGQLQRMSTAQLASESGKYMKELDALAKVTGVSREEKQREVDMLRNNAKVQAALAGIEDPEQRRKMQAYILSFPKEAQGAIADMISTGNMSTEEAVKLGVMLPGVAKEAMQFGRTLNAGGKITDQQINQSKNNAVKEAQSSLKRNKTLGLYADDLGNAFLATGAIASQGIDAYAKSLEEQKTATEKANMAEEVEKAKQQLAEISNQFMLFLASSGAIDTLMTAFQAFTSFAQAVLMPAFSILSEVLNRLVPIVSSYVVPMFQTLGNVVLSLSDFIFNNFEPVMIALAAIAIPSLIAKVTLAATAAGSMAMNLLKNVAALALMAIKMLPLVLAAGALYLAFKGVVWMVDNAADGFEAVTDGIKWLFSWLKTGMLSWYKLLFTGLSKLPLVGDKFKAAADGVGSMIEEEEKTREEIAKRSEERTKKRDAKAEAAKAKEAAEEQKAQKRKEDREKGALDRKSQRENKAIDDKAAKESANDTPTQDLSDPIAMLRSFADKNKSAFTQEAKALDQVDAARKEVVAANKSYNEAEEAVRKAKTDAEKKVAEETLAGAKKRRDEAIKAESSADKTAIAAAARMKGAKEGKDPGPPKAAAAKDEKKTATGTPAPVDAKAKENKVASKPVDAKMNAQATEKNDKSNEFAGMGDPTETSVASAEEKPGVFKRLFGGKSGTDDPTANKDVTATPITGLEDLVKNGIAPTTIAFQELNKKSIAPMMETGIKFAKLANTGAPTPESIKVVEQIKTAMGDSLKSLGEKPQQLKNAIGDGIKSLAGINSVDAKNKNDPTAKLESKLSSLTGDNANLNKDKIAADKMLASGMPKITANEFGSLKGLGGIDKLSDGIGLNTPASGMSKKTAGLDFDKSWIAGVEKDKKAKQDLDAKSASKNTANTDINPLKNTLTAAGAAQETPESLLSSLNMKMDELIRVSRQTADINSKQLSVQRNNSGDLFA